MSASQKILGKDFKTHSVDVTDLLRHVIRGEQYQAEKLITKSPELLFATGATKDFSGREYERKTALQLALGAKDFSVKKNEVHMTEMILYHLMKLPDGARMIKTQMEKQFPKGYKEKEAKILQDDVKALNKIIFAIDSVSQEDAKNADLLDLRILKAGEKDPWIVHLMNNILEAPAERHFNNSFNELMKYLQRKSVSGIYPFEAIRYRNVKEPGAYHIYKMDGGSFKYEFTKKFSAPPKNAIYLLKETYRFRNSIEIPKNFLRENYFNMALLVEALKVHVESDLRFGDLMNEPSHIHKQAYYWTKVIGYIERFVPTWLAQRICQYASSEKPLRRNLQFPCIFKNESYSYFYPLDCDSDFRLGYHFAAALTVDPDIRWSFSSPVRSQSSYETAKKIMLDNEIALESILRLDFAKMQYQTEQQGNCLIL